MDMNEKEFRSILAEHRDAVDETIKKSVKSSVEEAFTLVGIDTSQPLEAQKRSAFLDSLYTTSQTIKKRSLLVVVGGFITGAMTLAYLAVTRMFS